MAPPRRDSSSSSSSSSGSVEARVLVDLYSWHEEHGNVDSPVNTASRDETITVSAKEFERGQSMVPPALAKASEKNPSFPNEAPDLPEDLSELSEKELRDLAEQRGLDVDDDTTRDELVGKLAASPGNERPAL